MNAAIVSSTFPIASTCDNPTFRSLSFFFLFDLQVAVGQVPYKYSYSSKLKRGIPDEARVTSYSSKFEPSIACRSFIDLIGRGTWPSEKE